MLPELVEQPWRKSILYSILPFSRRSLALFRANMLQNVTPLLWLHYWLLLSVNAGDEVSPESVRLESYMITFKEKRKEQKDMLKRLVQMPGDQKHETVVNMLIDAMLPRIENARAVLEESGFIPGMAFPADLRLVDALSVLLEGTALFGELALYFPEFVEARWKNNDVRAPFSWSIGFCNSTEFYDENTTELMYLLGQELKLLPRDPRYTNPYRKTTYFKEKEEFSSKQRGEQPDHWLSEEL
ncbi:hypothetical protein M514_16364 [Trichuris suis]|uniref:Uncharacterized protein n=1 Tax=Trichuris suis TaxID=68888 RepID=A0A085NPN6_9BILA|nr:hypothetical protein M514_16364 [Trichuris suis]